MSAPAEVVVGSIVGAPIARKEDQKLLQGQAQWVDNMRLPGMVFLGVVRSPYAHARIANVNVRPALAHAGVVAHEGAMMEGRGSEPERAIEQELAGSGKEQVRAAHDLGDLHRGIIHHHGELVGSDAVVSCILLW